MIQKNFFKPGVNIIKESFFMILGILVAGFGLKGFLIPNGFIDGGMTGVSLLIHFLTPISISILLILVNIPFILMARKQIGKIFAVKSFIAIVGLAFCIALIKYPIITSDKLLVAVFGGFLLGTGTGLAIRGGSVIDGTEILSIYMNKKTGLSVGEVIFIVNIIIYSIAAIFLGLERALYSILTYLVAAKVVDFMIDGIEEYVGLTIISKKSKNIRKMLTSMGMGLTVYKGEKGYSRKGDPKIDILYMVITRLEVTKVKNKVLAIDESSVIIESPVKSAHGGIMKKKPLSH